MEPRIPQLWWSVAQVAAMFAVGESTIRQWIREGRFGSGADFCILLCGSDLRISSRALFLFQDQCPVVRAQPVAARTPGELRRKINGR